MRPAQGFDEFSGDSLDGVAARNAAPFAGFKVILYCAGGKAGKLDNGIGQPRMQPAVRRRDRDAAENVMAAAREQFQALLRFFFCFGFGKNTPATGDDCVSSEDKTIFMSGGDSAGFFLREAQRVIARKFTLAWRFVDIGGNNLVGRNPELGQKIFSVRRCRGEDKFISHGR